MFVDLEQVFRGTNDNNAQSSGDYWEANGMHAHVNCTAWN
jgi:hypothetical protein